MPRRKPSPRNEPLRTKVQGGRLVISVGINTLAFAFDHSNDNQEFNEKSGEFRPIAKVTSPVEFARGVIRALTQEEEDGTTPVHLMLDKASMSALEDGSLGLEFLT